jgi:hypothetical protein
MTIDPDVRKRLEQEKVGRDGGDFYVPAGTATLRHDHAPSRAPGFLDKYHDDIVGPLATTVEAIDGQYDTEIRVRVRSVRGA